MHVGDVPGFGSPLPCQMQVVACQSVTGISTTVPFSTEAGIGDLAQRVLALSKVGRSLFGDDDRACWHRHLLWSLSPEPRSG